MKPRRKTKGGGRGRTKGRGGRKNEGMGRRMNQKGAKKGGGSGREVFREVSGKVISRQFVWGEETHGYISSCKGKNSEKGL